MKAFIQFAAFVMLFFSGRASFFENRNKETTTEKGLQEVDSCSPIDKMKNRFTDLFNTDFISQWIPPVNTLVPYSMMMDIKETEKFYELTADLPGVDKKDIDVQVDGTYLTITAVRSARKDVENHSYKKTERFTGRISRTITLPDTIDQSAIEAVCTNGVLHLKMPKVSEGFRQAKNIEVK